MKNVYVGSMLFLLALVKNKYFQLIASVAFYLLLAYWLLLHLIYQEYEKNNTIRVFENMDVLSMQVGVVTGIIAFIIVWGITRLFGMLHDRQ
ncbi:hypothetical protein [Halalkalibacter hemicellulosilyticus]|uniref:Uncharacterized protein n=1 Tax=Halalkalibacter hemicellulosilyticusJCM 9152 TaxID=1236971 RepID=W4QMI7_9BACI|nr:hypothetical protein [Halalkalibacter hemicellulosilyticus]GAE32858.1 hypothetical protein JCM9152_4445 [Halalkalibacter hemicellulosilyticusJCM 9152]